MGSCYHKVSLSHANRHSTLVALVCREKGLDRYVKNDDNSTSYATSILSIKRRGIWKRISLKGKGLGGGGNHKTLCFFTILYWRNLLSANKVRVFGVSLLLINLTVVIFFYIFITTLSTTDKRSWMGGQQVQLPEFLAQQVQFRSHRDFQSPQVQATFQ